MINSKTVFWVGAGEPGGSNENFKPSHFNLPIDYVIQD